MRNYITLFIAISACLSPACNQKKNKNNETGKVSRPTHTAKSKRPNNIKLVGKLPEGKSISFFYADQFDDRHQFKIDGKKDSIFGFYSPYPTLLFTAGDLQAPYLLYPGETITVSPAKQGKGIQLRAVADSIKNDELTFFQKSENTAGKRSAFSIFYSLIRPNSFLLTTRGKPDFHMMTRNARKAYDQQMGFLRNYSRTHPVSPGFAWFCKKYFYYNMILNELIPFIPEKYTRYSYPGAYLDTLYSHQPDFNCDSCLAVWPYRIAVNYYLKFLSRESLDSANSFPAMWKNIMDHFSGETKDYLLFHLVQKKLQKNPGYYALIKKKFFEECSNDEYKDHISNRYNTFLSLKNDKDIKGTVLLAPGGKKLTWDSILKRNTGKVIYLDFWASWCVPCRAGMPHSLKLQANYAGKNITFAYISIDKKRTNWLRAVNELKLPASNNYILSETEDSKFLDYLNIASIPRYILIDSRGNIIDLNAPGPGEREIDQELDLLLSEKPGGGTP